MEIKIKTDPSKFKKNVAVGIPFNYFAFGNLN